METPLLPLYAPGLASAGQLDELLVTGAKTVERLVEGVVQDVRSGSRHYSLLLGPAGAGKSHLLALVRYRLEAREELAGNILPVTLPHETWGIGSCNDLLERILDQLPADPASLEDPLDRMREEVAGRLVVLFIEDLAGLFAGLSEEEQLRFRGFLQQEKCCTILAGARESFPAVAHREAPFFGFFRAEHLAGLDPAGAERLVVTILERLGRQDLARSLEEGGRPGLRAVLDLVGCRPRLLVKTAHLLAARGKADPVAVVPALLEGEIPAAAALEEQLSRQQCQLVEALVLAPGALQVKVLARLCGVTEQTASGQLRTLRAQGLVEAHRSGRTTHVELMDPVIRNCLRLHWGLQGSLEPVVSLLRRFHQGGPFPGEVLASENAPGLVRQWSERGDLAALALGLILDRDRLADPMVSTAAAKSWIDSWSRVESQESALSVRLVEAWFRHRVEEEKGALFGLAREERRLLELLGQEGEG